MATESNDPKVLKKQKLVLAIIGIIVLIGIVAVNFNDLPFNNKVRGIIKRDASTVYQREGLGLPSEFKSILMDSNDMVWLGYAREDDEDYYCISSSTTFENYVSSYLGYTYVTIKAELVFTKKDWAAGRIGGYANVYHSKHILDDPISSYQIRVSINENYLRGSGKSALHYLGEFDTSEQYRIEMFTGDLLAAFDSFLEAHDIKEFHRS